MLTGVHPQLLHYWLWENYLATRPAIKEYFPIVKLDINTNTLNTVKRN